MAESRREANKRKIRQKILKASRRLFKENGYENTMIEDVANKAEISKATLYNYFPNKESLLAGTMDEVTESLGKYIDDMDENTDVDKKIRDAMTFLIWDSIPLISISRRIFFLNACSDSTMYGKVNAAESLLEKLVDEGKEKSVYSKAIDTKDIVDQLMGVYLISLFQWADLEEMEEQQCIDRVNHLMDLALAGCYNK